MPFTNSAFEKLLEMPAVLPTELYQSVLPVAVTTRRLLASSASVAVLLLAVRGTLAFDCQAVPDTPSTCQVRLPARQEGSMESYSKSTWYR